MIATKRLLVSLAIASLVAGCARENKAPLGAASGPIIVSVAASAQDAVAKIAGEFQQQSGTEVKLNPGPSSGLANQIIEGAPADLFLSANRQWANAVEKAGLADSSTPLLTNQLVIVVPKGNPAAVKTPVDLTTDQVRKLALAAEKVPAGIYAEQALKSLDLWEKLNAEQKIVRGQDVRVALTYVARGEAEAGIVYSTDVRAADEVEAVYSFDPKTHDEIVYVLVLLKHASGNAGAPKLYTHLQGDAARRIFAEYGFTSFSPTAASQ